MCDLPPPATANVQSTVTGGQTKLAPPQAILSALKECCPRVEAWLGRYEKGQAERIRFGTSPSGHLAASHSASGRVTELVRRCREARKNLFWIDTADVASVREIVRFCQQVGGTIHVGHSTGAVAARRVLLNEGWLGSTLPEVATHADLVITLGDGWRSESPRLAERFLSRARESARQEPARQQSASGAVAPGSADSKGTLARDCASVAFQWWHISESEAVPAISKQSPAPTQILVWPRQSWLERLTELLLMLPGDNRELPAVKVGAKGAMQAALAQQLVQSQNAVFVWQNSDLTSELDELIVSRLHAIARSLTRESRCSLLNLESNVGRLTADETLLWLTGCAGTARWNGTSWEQPAEHGYYLLDDWRREFDHIVLVRAAASLDPLPSLVADAVVAGQGDLVEYAAGPALCVPVVLAGIAEPGYFFRGDRGIALLAGLQPPASEAGATAGETTSTAAELFRHCQMDLSKRTAEPHQAASNAPGRESHEH